MSNPIEYAVRKPTAKRRIFSFMAKLTLVRFGRQEFLSSVKLKSAQ